MTLTMNPNGRTARKSLAEQIDRLDSILDGFADALNESVASAVKEAVGIAVHEAVRVAVTEVLTNVELHKHLASALSSDPPEIKSTGLAGGWGGALKTGWGKVAAVANQASARVAAALSVVWTGMKAMTGRSCTKVASFARATWLRGLVLLCLAKRFKKPVLISLGVGGVVGLGCFFAGPVLGSVVSGLAGFAGSLGVGMLNALRRLLGAGLAVGA